MKEIPLYIHIPFCRSKCSYCAFYSCINHSESQEKNLVRELKAQISSLMELSGASFCNTIYIGGGTPSLLANKNLQDLLGFLNKYINNSLKEFTIECNPEDVDSSFIQLLNKSRVNRISLGVQSFQDHVLKASGRKTELSSIASAISCITNEWSGKFSIDIISGLPGQTKDGQKDDIDKAVASGADHISCYSLIIEENTPFSEANDQLPGIEESDCLWDICREALILKGFEHYEVSNFCKPGFESQHNMHYWRMNEYIGCGPGAVSMINKNGVVRISNPHNLNDYLKGESVFWSAVTETIESEDFLFENYMMGLRTKLGIDREKFHKRFNRYPEELIKETIKTASENTFILSDVTLSLSDESRLFMNSLLIKISDELEAIKIDFTVKWP